jgi:hypothetical protein
VNSTSDSNHVHLTTPGTHSLIACRYSDSDVRAISAPRETRGIVDTLGTKLPTRIHRFDDPLFRDWKRTTLKGIRTEFGGRLHFDTDGYQLLSRREDGLRVICKKNHTVLEVSVPRFCGLKNNIAVESICESRLSQAILRLKRRCLPWTSELYRMATAKYLHDDEPVPECWQIARIDLAVNFHGPVQLILEAYSKTHYHRIRELPVRYPNSLVWKGEDWRLTIYDKGFEQGLKPNELGRVELQIRTCTSLDELGCSLPWGSDFRFPDGGARNLSLPHLHQFLRREVESLEPTVTAFPRITKLRQAGILFAAMDPLVWESLRCHMSKRNFQRVQKEIEAQKCALNPSIRLADLCWPSAQSADRARSA